jgi:predicted phage terminase large subunit-like protein
MIEAERVVLPEYAPWLNDFEEQLLAFPYGNHDDFVDSLTQYLDWLRLSNAGKAWIRGL